MKVFHTLFALLALVACSQASPATSDAPYILENVTVIDGTGAPSRPHMTIVVQNGRIADVFVTGDRPLNGRFERRDLGGRFVTPGLIDTHVHLATFDRQGLMDEILQNALEGGVTSVRDMGGNGAVVSGLARRQRSDELQAPEIFYSALVTGPESEFWITDDRAAYVSNGAAPGTMSWFRHLTATADFDAFAREARAFGATGIKVHSGFDAPTLLRLTAAARREHLHIWGHATLGPATASDFIAAGAEAISHADMLGYEGVHGRDVAYWSQPYPERQLQALRATPADGPLIGALLENMRQRNAVLEPTLFIVASSIANSERNNPNVPRWQEAYDYAKAITRRANAMGVPIAAGTDAIGRESPWLHSELQLLVRDGGLTPLQAIRAATSTAARVIGQDADRGKIAPGMRADLVVYARDPSADIRNTLSITAVVQSGRVIRRNGPIPPPPLAQAAP